MQSGVGKKSEPASNMHNDSDEDLFELIDRLEATVEQARGIPFTSSCMVDREEMLILISMVRENLPNAIRQAKLVLDQNRHIIAEARKEAESIMREAEVRMASMINEHEITRKAQIEGAQIIENANISALKIRKTSMDYARKHLNDLEEQLTEMLVTIQRNKKELK